MQQGDYGQAVECWCKRMGPGWDEPGTRTALEGLVDVAIACCCYEWAARLLGAAEAQRNRMGVQIRPAARARYEQTLETVRVSLDPELFRTAWDDGRRRSAGEARDLARASAEFLGGAAPTPATTIANRYGLTRREREVLELVAVNRTNRQIADALFISVPTVKRHLTTAYTKLGVDSRAAAAVLLFDEVTDRS
jgi:DNA-binding CsgD family transcriptional regulator